MVKLLNQLSERWSSKAAVGVEGDGKVKSRRKVKFEKEGKNPYFISFENIIGL